MSLKLVLISSFFAVTLAAYNGPLAGGQPAALYPAGIDPKACPNFPDCSNPAVAVNQVPEQPQYQQPQYQQPQYQQPQPQYQQPQYQQPQYQPQQYTQSQKPQYSAEIQNALNRGEYIGDGDYHDEGLAEALAPGYASVPQQRVYNPSPAVSQYNPAVYNPAQYSQAGAHAQPAQIPAGVDARSCPNYPFCA
ncbi:DNA translocase FtsK-like [Diorhabda sublineata]|uniref:DNA translocase FtsK-like n=1 Tax=Diorhabda sublineata TaxID=1163346 RepID=UPI0024E187C9|nr:DNA translocase FtsK-like [Diorhabda sublineata]